jgi:hypothetical protein
MHYFCFISFLHMQNVRFKTLTAVNRNIAVFRHGPSVVRKKSTIISKEPKAFILMLETEALNSSEKFGTYLPNYTGSHPRRPWSIYISYPKCVEINAINWSLYYSYCDVHALANKVNRGRALRSNWLARNNRRNCGLLCGPFRGNNRLTQEWMFSLGSDPRFDQWVQRRDQELVGWRLAVPVRQLRVRIPAE